MQSPETWSLARPFHVAPFCRLSELASNGFGYQLGLALGDKNT